MRIGIFDPYLDDLGGGEKYMMTIADHLSQSHQVDVFWENKKDLEILQQRFELNLKNITLVPNIFDPRVSFMHRLIKSRNYDRIIILSDGSLPLLLSKKTLIHFQQPLSNVKPGFKKLIKKARISAYFCNSKFTKSFIDKEFDVNSTVLYPPVENKAKKIAKENIILHVGRFRVNDVTTNISGKNQSTSDYKKQGVMVNLFKQMVDQGLKNWKFILAVSVNDREVKLFDDFRKNTMGYPIEFLVNKTNDELWEIYSRAKIYWHASGFGEDLASHPEFAEHFGISTVEAMFAGAVPLVINAGGQKEIVSDGEDGFLWDTLEELKSKTLKLIHDEKLIAQLSMKATLAAKKFDKNNFFKKVDELIE